MRSASRTRRSSALALSFLPRIDVARSAYGFATGAPKPARTSAKRGIERQNIATGRLTLPHHEQRAGKRGGERARSVLARDDEPTILRQHEAGLVSAHGPGHGGNIAACRKHRLQLRASAFAEQQPR